MPSHQERVRRNYLTTNTAAISAPQTNEIVLRLHISKHAIASWTSIESAQRDILRRVQAELKAIWPKSKV